MNTNKYWYAIYTKPKWEKKVAELLGRKKIDNFCPLYKSVKQWSDRKKTVLEPLFTSYVFVHIDEAAHIPIRQTDGVLNFVYWLGKPAIIKDEEIETIRSFLTDYSNVRLEKIQVNVTDKVRIMDGPFKYWEGDVTEVRSGTVKVMLPSLGYALIAEIPKARIEVLTVTDRVYGRNAV